MTPFPRVSVIGLGNVFLGDDAFGCMTVELFRSTYECGAEVEVIDVGTPGLDLVPYMYGRELVIIVDAVAADGAPGTVRIYSESEFQRDAAQLRLTGHDPGLRDALAQLRLVGCEPSEVLVVGVVPESCAYGARITPTVLAASSEAITRIAKVLEQHAFDCSLRPHPVEPNLWWVSHA